MIIFNFKSLLQIVAALIPAFFLTVLALGLDWMWLFLFAVASYGATVAALDVLWRRAAAKDRVGLVDMISPARGGHVFFLPTWLWGTGWTLMASRVFVGHLLSGDAAIEEPVAGDEEFQEANAKIGVHVEGPTAMGNSPEAVALAAQLQETLTLFRTTFITGEDGRFSLSGGEFLTYCHMDDDSVVFLVHVPGLRKYDGEAKMVMNGFAWTAAQQLVVDRPVELAVGVRGALLYDEVMIGGTAGEPSIGEREMLYDFFAPPAPVVTTATR